MRHTKNPEGARKNLGDADGRNEGQERFEEIGRRARQEGTAESKYRNDSISSTYSVEEKVVYADSSGEAREKPKKEGRKRTKEAREHVRELAEKK